MARPARDRLASAGIERQVNANPATGGEKLKWHGDTTGPNQGGVPPYYPTPPGHLDPPLTHPSRQPRKMAGAFLWD